MSNFKEELKSLFLRSVFLKDLYIVYYVKRTKLQIPIWGGDVFEDEISNSLNVFLKPEEHLNKKVISKVKKDIIYCYLRYGSTPQEYFLLGFRDMADTRRKALLTNMYKDIRLIKTSGLDLLFNDLRDKYNFYQKLSQYFNRDVCKLEKETDFQSFYEFCLKHPTFMLKPNDGRCGVGVKICKLSSSEAEIHDFYNSIIDRKETFIVEELIIQSPSVAVWNDSSVNTVRLHTFLNASGFHVLGPAFRTGRKGSVVDNAACGGILANIDPETGIIFTDGVDESGNSYRSHPDSHIVYKGWQVPHWNELLSFAKEIHHKMATHKYIGWDFAFTEKGWVLIEGDWARFLCEYADKRGIKKEFDLLLGKISR